MTKYF